MSRLSTSWLRWLAGGWLISLLTVSLLADFISLPYAADTTDLAATAEPPGTGMHYLGTDPLGRDLLAGLLYGARTALLVSLPAAALATLLGTLIGSVAGFWGNTRLRIPVRHALIAGTAGIICLLVRGPAAGLAVAAAVVALLLWPPTRRGPRRTVILPIDEMVLGLMALLAAIPLLLLALTLAALQPPSWVGLLTVLICTYWPGPARLARAEVLRIRALPYTTAGQALGIPAARLLWRHVLPNAWPIIRSTFPLSVAALIGLETTLSFLGVGLPLDTPSWGRTLATVRLAPTAWWLIIGPTLAILLTTLSLYGLAAWQRRT